jgi:hypothetical protein
MGSLCRACLCVLKFAHPHLLIHHSSETEYRLPNSHIRMTPSITQSSNTNEGRDVIRNDLFSLVSIPGKGKGLIATQRITAGTCLISESPLFTTSEIKTPNVELELMRIIKALPKEKQRAFLSLHNNNPGKEPFSNIVRSNGYPLGPSSEAGGIFLNIARINHGCLANTQQAFNGKIEKETAYAIRDIEEGEEITIAYTIGGPSSVRKAKLREFFGFDCACTLCSLPERDLVQSDKRYITAASLDEKIGDSKRVKRIPEKVLAECKEILTLYEEEGIKDSRLSRLYYDAFQICILHSDEARASVLAEKYLNVKIVCEGEDCSDVEEMRKFARAPKSHGSYGSSMRWKQDIEKIPSDLDEEGMKKWLWREG